MNKVIRLSVCNLKKHKLEAVFLAVLIMICTLLLGSSLASSSSINRIFPDMMERTGCWENMIVMPRQHFNQHYIDLLLEDENVTEADHIELIYDQTTRYLDLNGKEQSVFMSFISEYQESRLENFLLETDLSDDEIAALDHPIYMPYAARDTFLIKPGDDFHLICGTRRFTFTVAGFYESVYFSDTGTGIKMVVKEQDYNLLKSILTNCEMVVFNTNDAGKDSKTGVQIVLDFLKRCEDYSGQSITMSITAYETYSTIKQLVEYSLKILLYAMGVMAFAIILCVAFMIRFRITNDIQEQIVSIGVLEALGYQSRQIALSYTIEYCMIAAVSVLTGICFSSLLEPTLFRYGEIMCGHHGTNHNNIALIAAAGIVIFILIAVSAYIKAAIVRKYPPVVAFRKGIHDHHFGKERFPLRNTKGNVHIRLAMKHFLHNTKQNIGLAFCILFAVFAITECFILYSFLGTGSNVIQAVAGVELSDLHIELVPNIDTEAFAEELRELPEVRKLLENASSFELVMWTDQNTMMMPTVIRDFNDTENIFPSEGRFPQHDNEVMLTALGAMITHTKIGDSIPLTTGKGEQNFVVTGLVTSITNGGANIYLTEDGMKRLNPLYHPLAMEIYLNDSVDADSFRAQLCERYGRSLADLQQDESESQSYEERIRLAADKKIAELMSVHDVSHVEYAIQCGDKMITGNSNNFRIRSFISLSDIIKTQTTQLSIAISASTSAFMIISAVVVMIVLFILMESTVKKQRKDLGIMKGMGYTSKELMFQLAFRIMPSALIGVVLGTIISIHTTSLLTSFFGKISVNIPAVLALACVILVFCFICAYVGARKIKKISVCELMTE